MTYYQFVPSEFFKYYDFYEEIDETLYKTENESKLFKHDYGKGEKTYRYSNYSIYISENETKFYRTVHEKITDEELEELIPYCRCYSCTTNNFFGGCPCCSGCLTDICSQDILGKTKEYFNSKDKITNKEHHEKYFREQIYNPLKFYTMSAILFILSCLCVNRFIYYKI